MPVVKIPESIRAELASIGLTVWLAQHPMIYKEVGATRPTMDKTRVTIQLNGPGLGAYSPWGKGATVREAVDDAMAHPVLIDRVPGLKGCILRLDRAAGDLTGVLRVAKFCYGRPHGDLDDEVPF